LGRDTLLSMHGLPRLHMLSCHRPPSASKALGTRRASGTLARATIPHTNIRGNSGSRLRNEQTGTQQFQLQSRRGGPHHRAQSIIHQIRGTRDLRGTQMPRLHLHALKLILRHRRKNVRGVLPRQRNNNKIPQPLQQVLNKAPRIMPGLHHSIHHREHRGAIIDGKRLNKIVKQ